MDSILHLLHSWICQALQSKFNYRATTVAIAPASQRQFGHYQCNEAMKLGPSLKRIPREVALEIAQYLQTEHSQQIQKVEVAGPGFINITLSDEFLISRAKSFSLRTCVSKWPYQRVLVDFSSPNTAKEMHVGHLRSTIIGDSLARIFEFIGCEVLRVNHIGDWGTGFGMLIAWLQDHYGSQELANIASRGQCDWDLAFLMNAYKLAKLRFDCDEDFAKKAKAHVVALQAHEPVSYRIWQMIGQISRKAYAQIYQLLNIRIHECGESFYNPFLAPMVQDLEQRGFVQISDGAKCIFIDGYNLPLMLQKSDGGFNYDTTDMAALRYRTQELKVDQILYVTDAGQKLHFELIFEAGRKVGYLPQHIRVDHVPFGLVLGPDGKKFKTRSGQTEKLIDLLQLAVERASQILQERQIQDDGQELAKAIGLNAVKYADLSNYRLSDYSFSYEKMLRFEGNTAAFLMYSYVRTKSLLKRLPNPCFDNMKLEHASERQLLLTCLQFGYSLEQTLADLAPNRLCEYLWALSQDFNAFFRDCRVEGSDQQSQRLALVELCNRILGCGLELLGLRLVEKM